MGEIGRYLYAIIDSAHPVEFGLVGMPGGDPLVYTIHHRQHQDLRACVSNYPTQAEIKADAERLLAHERVLETIMKRFTILPFQCGVIAPSEQEVLRLLSRHRGRIKLALRSLRERVEVTVRAHWKSLHSAAQEVVREHAAIARYRQEIAARPPEETHRDRNRIGMMVAAALDAKRTEEASRLMGYLRRIAVDVTYRPTVGDTMVLNASFLIRKADYPRIERALESLGQRNRERLDFSYSGPLPPHSFVNMVLEG